MYKYRFLKNNKKVQINEEEINYFSDDLIIKKENINSIIILDFKNKKCELKIGDLKLEIPVNYMSYNLSEKEDIFEYSLASEDAVKNTIIINK